MLKRRLQFLHYLHEQLYSLLLLQPTAGFNIHEQDEEGLYNAQAEVVDTSHLELMERIHIHVRALKQLRLQTGGALMGSNGQVLLVRI